MTKAELKEKRRANRRIKRQAEHQQRMEEKMAQMHDEAVKERFSIKNKYGKSDPTAYYAILNVEGWD